ncbi:Uncharacterized protein APZ42_017579 [Daphnia magna]|uniref:Uncharacterized protein n=1 Tax=Daphnia magna TaxID=35525 RepID=A0A164ZYC7_9CRUS|nr:Uncharacterized protein APZ42_017579 [Daphnia magna]
MLLYADDVTAEGNDAVTDLITNKTLERSVILIDTDSDENPANLTNETQIISSPSILSDDSSRAGERSNKRMYRCTKCGKSKKGHVCSKDSCTSSEDPDWVASRRIDGSSIRTSPRLLARKRTVSTIVTETEEKELQTIPKKARKVYECRNCHVKLKGHKCPHKLIINRLIRQLSVILDRVDQE